MNRRWLVLLFAALLPAQEVRVTSFNVRYPSQDDGENLWEKRKDILVEAVRRMDPDVIGTQELFQLQGNYIVEKLPAYAWIGVSRRGNTEDEYMGVFYKKSKWRVVESGNFWLSETPEVAGSSSWGMSLPRMATWALLEPTGGRGRFYFVNTHMAHRREDEAARQKGAMVLQEWLGRLDTFVPVILTGDFNSPAEGGTYQKMITGFADAWKIAEHRTGPEGTFHGFRGVVGPARIDWIFLRGTWRVKEAEAVTWNEGGRYPSDHLPVRAVVELERGNP
jgi:endonuclease/exonuclease/phosphatase family metal-dependent hydrolase